MAAVPEADFTVEEEASADESSDDDMPLDPYWAAKLNVSKVAEPQAVPSKEPQLDEEKGKGRKGKASGGAGKGFAGKGPKGGGKYGKAGKHSGYSLVAYQAGMPAWGFYGPPVGPAAAFAGGKGMKGAKGAKPWKGHRGGGSAADDIGDFVAWAKDPSAEDGNRRERSRSPRRSREKQNLEDFLSWARECSVQPEPQEDEEDEPAEGIGDFLAWAAAGSGHRSGGGHSKPPEEEEAPSSRGRSCDNEDE